MKTVVFITAVNDIGMYQECIKHILHLHMPEWEKVQISFFPIFNAQSMTEAYNQGMMLNRSANYKVYLHQDLMITDKDFLIKMIRAFEADKDLGLLGVVGCESMPVNGIWWEGKILGQFIDNHTGVLHEYHYCESDKVQYAEAVDGCIMCTQADIFWNTELFDGWHFYDASQCFKMKNLEYKVGVLPSMITHLCGICNMNGYEEARQRFVNQYMGDRK